MTSYLRAVAPAAAVFFAILAVTPAVAAEEASDPSFWVEEHNLNLGTIIAGSVATATFVSVGISAIAFATLVKQGFPQRLPAEASSLNSGAPRRRETPVEEGSTQRVVD